MGQRGFLTKHNSTRDIAAGGHSLDAPETVTCPDWLSGPAKKEFRLLVTNMIAANVPIKELDAYAVACCAQCIASVSTWSAEEQKAETFKEKLDCSKQVARHQRDSQRWLEMLGATPASRARIGIQSAPTVEGSLAKLMKAKQQSSAT